MTSAGLAALKLVALSIRLGAHCFTENDMLKLLASRLEVWGQAYSALLLGSTTSGGAALGLHLRRQACWHTEQFRLRCAALGYRMATFDSLQIISFGKGCSTWGCLKTDEFVALQTNAMSSAMCNLTFMSDSIMYVLNVSNLMSPTAAHIHAGYMGKLNQFFILFSQLVPAQYLACLSAPGRVV